jgi:para-aminobenzoate synthetase
MHKLLLIDNYDSYTYNLYQLIASVTRTEPVVMYNDDPRLKKTGRTEFTAVVISPGPGHPAHPRDIGLCGQLLERRDLPVLGVCLGHQAIGLLAGAEVNPAPEPRHGHVSRISHQGAGVFAGIPDRFAAVRYHSLRVDPRSAPDIEVTAWAEDGVVMGIQHRALPRWGVQFHPESISSEHGAAIVANFLDLAARTPGEAAR